MKILFQGDSITAGQIYVNMVSGRLGADYPGEHEFINRGISGNRVVDIYARIKKDILNLKPDFMSILIGVNDVWHEVDYMHDGVDADKYGMVYELLIQEVKAALLDIKIMILEPFVLKGTATEEQWEYFSKEVPLRAAKAKQIAEKYGLTFVPLQEKFDECATKAPTDYWLRDGVHPTPMGSEIIAREWVRAFKTM